MISLHRGFGKVIVSKMFVQFPFEPLFKQDSTLNVKGIAFCLGGVVNFI